MKRISNVYGQVISINNLLLAHKNACKGKSKQKGVITFKKNLMPNIIALHNKLKNGEYKNPEYKVFTIYEPKERIIYVLPYESRIIHHAILQIVGDMFVKNFTHNTYSCIKGRGIHKALTRIKTALKDVGGTTYCLKIDVTQFYPSVDHEVLKNMLLRKIKDKQLLWLLFEIIDSAVGLPIGNYLSQTLANFYLSPLDHWIKEELKVKYIWRYCDDIVIFHHCKKQLHEFRSRIEWYMWYELKLKMKSNYQVFPIKSRGADFLGYVSDHDKVLLRPSIKNRFAKMLKYNPNQQSIASYNGWLKHGNCINLKRTLLAQFNETTDG